MALLLGMVGVGTIGTGLIMDIMVGGIIIFITDIMAIIMEVFITIIILIAMELGVVTEMTMAGIPSEEVIMTLEIIII
jgi:hypothetical protein